MTTALRGLGALAITALLPLISLFANNRVSVPLPATLSPTLLPPPVHRLQAYLRIRTDHSGPDYHAATAFLNRTIATLLPHAHLSAHEFVPGKPVLLAVLHVPNNLPALLLNSHSDVVPAEPDKWLWPPFDARMIFADKQWRIYARGAQDMKSVGMQYVEALAALYETGWRPGRTVVVSFVPDEEIGGRDGMGRFVKSPVFRSLNIGVALDEGLPNPGPRYNLYYGERQTWWLAIKVEGSPGHGATLPHDTAAQLLHRIVGKVLQFRERQLIKMHEDVSDIGDVVGINLVYLKAGQEDRRMPTGHIMNMVPSVAEAGFDIRVPPLVDPRALENLIQSWMHCDDGRMCPGTTYKWVIKVEIPNVTSLDPIKNPHYAAFTRGLQSAGIDDKVNKGIFFAATDARYLRELNIPTFGFSPIVDTAVLLHKHNEYISMDGYMKGCKIYEEIIRHMAGSPVDLELSKASAIGSLDEYAVDDDNVPVDNLLRMRGFDAELKDDL